MKNTVFGIALVTFALIAVPCFAQATPGATAPATNCQANAAGGVTPGQTKPDCGPSSTSTSQNAGTSESNGGTGTGTSAGTGTGAGAGGANGGGGSGGTGGGNTGNGR